MKQILLSNLSNAIEQLRKILLKAQSDEPVIYLEVRGGTIINAYSTEEAIISIKDSDTEGGESHDDTWDDMIEQGINSGELIKISIIQ